MCSSLTEKYCFCVIGEFAGFEFEYLGEFNFMFGTSLGYQSQDQAGSLYAEVVSAIFFLDC